MSKLEKILLAANVLLYGFLAVFSYAYVDLNLTLSQNPAALEFVGLMQQLGYYHRPQATFIYVIFIAVAFSFFVLNLFLFAKSKISLKYLKVATVVNTLILIFAYPFLSSDLFNYLFDAKIITHYHVSPYNHRALDFPQDDWIRFMRWVHRYSPYGPAWLGMSLIPSFLGFGKFLLTFFTFKVFIGIFHLVNSRIIYKVLEKVNPKQALFGTAFYALNPLFLIEGIANGHNDLVFATFLLLPIYFSLAKRKEILFAATFLIGVLIKYISVLNLPWYIVRTYLKKPKGFENFVILNILTMAVFTFLYSTFRITVPFVSSGSTQVQFQPWYLFWTIPLIAFIPNPFYMAVAIILVIGSMLRYLPFIYFGDWSTPGTIQYMRLVTVLPTFIALFVVAVLKFRKR
ncbi:MAG: hypothetical protein Q7S45_03990 [Candidatus Curtissbacteria bacterium]|nr:hypothetical protein [Candidatus Curtissbacteria bacterium]